MHLPFSFKQFAQTLCEGDIASYVSYTQMLAQSLMLLAYHWNRQHLQPPQVLRRSVAAPVKAKKREAHNHRKTGRRMLLSGRKSQLQRIFNWLQKHKANNKNKNKRDTATNKPNV